MLVSVLGAGDREANKTCFMYIGHRPIDNSLWTEKKGRPEIKAGRVSNTAPEGRKLQRQGRLQRRGGLG